MNDILARRARRAAMGIALSAALAAGIAPVTAIAAETSSPVDAVALQTEDAATEKEKAHAAMQEALKNLEAAKDAASPEKIAEIDADIAASQELHDMMLAEAAKRREPLPAMQADVDAAQAKYDEAHNRVIELQAKLKEAYDNGDYAAAQQLRSEIMMADSRERSCEYELAHYRSRLESQKGHVQYFESAAEEAKASVDESIAKRNALTDDLEKAQAAYDDASLQLGATGRGGTARQFTRDRQRRRIKLHQASEHKQRQASNYDRRQARKHRRHNAKRNRTSRNRRHGARNNHHSHPPHQELKIADRAFCLHQSTSPETKRGSFPQPRETSLFTCKNRL